MVKITILGLSELNNWNAEFIYLFTIKWKRTGFSLKVFP